MKQRETRTGLVLEFCAWALPRVAVGLAGLYALALALWAVHGG